MAAKSSMSIANLCSPLDTVDDYCITLDKPVFFPGEDVSGTVTLVTNSPINCRGVHVELVGRSSARLFPDNQTEGLRPSMFDLGKRKERFYARERKTIWGNVVKTLTIDGAGTRAAFGAPWAPKEGIIMVPVPQNGARHIVIRVMDEDLNKTDDKLGEVLIDPAALATAHEPQRYRLRRNGKPGYGEIEVEACWADESKELTAADLEIYSHLAVSGDRLLHMSVIQCVGLRDFDLFSSNDVYCMAYPLPENFPVDGEKALPSPAKTQGALPECEMVVPFRFRLPEKLPPSLEENDRTFVRYSIYSYIDIAWKQNPSARGLFTILNKNPIEYRFPHIPQAFYNEAVVADAARSCCGLLPGKKKLNDLKLQVGVPRRGFACGETITVDIQVTNAGPQQAQIESRLVRHFQAEVFSKPTVWTEVLITAPEEQRKGVSPGEKTNFMQELVVPAMAPSFKGNDPAYMDDVRWLNKNPRGEIFAPAEGLKHHPVTWSDVIEVLTIINGEPEVRIEIDIMVLSFPPCSPARVISGDKLVPAAETDERALLRAAAGGGDDGGNNTRSVTVVYVPDPNGRANLSDPDRDTYTFRPESLVWAPLVPIVKPETVEPAWHDSK